jgi:IrrE N-terminal-like domain
MTLKLDDPCVKSLMGYHGADGNPADLINRLCGDLLDVTGAEVPVDLEILASFRNAYVGYAEQEQAETIHWDGNSFRICLRKADSLGRQRFSCAHAIVHTWFFQSAGHGADGTSVQYKWSETEEDLCDLGAAALLLPEKEFRAACPAEVTIDAILCLAQEFQASAEATALRAVALSDAPLAMAVLEMRLKPTEQRALASQRLRQTLPGMDCPIITPRLRVVKSFGPGMAYLPRHKSVGDGTPLASILDLGKVDYIGEIGIVSGTYRVSAKNLPIRRGHEIADRVVMLIAPDG